MRKLKIMTVLLVGIIGFFIFSLTIKASTELKVSIDIEKDRIEFKNEEVIYSRKSMKCYELKTEEEEILAHHLYSYDEAYGIILYKSYIGEQYTLEGYVVVEEGIKTCLQKISKEEYEYLIKDAEEVIDTTELGNKLKRKQGRFEAYHTYVLDNPIREEEIESYALERHGKSIESMTKTDEYIKGYYPSYESSSPYIRTYTDNIINIVPEEWFFKEGSYGYVGKEYAVAVTTKPAKSHDYDNDCMLANVGVFDIDVALPYLSRPQNSYFENYFPDLKEYTDISNILKISIKPIINMSYYGYEKKNFRSDYWNRKFDPSEERTVVAKKESSNTIFIEPKSMGLLIDDSESNKSDNLKINSFKYEMTAKSRLKELLEKVDLQIMGFTSLVEMTNVLISLGIFKEPIDLTDKSAISLVKIITKNFVKMFISEQAEIKKNNLRGAEELLLDEKNKMKYEFNPQSWGDKRPICFTMNHLEFSCIFSNVVLGDYSHEYLFEFSEKDSSKWEPNFNYFYDLHLSSIFNFYDNYNFKVNNIASNQTYSNLNMLIDNTEYNGSFPKVASIFNGSELTTSLSTTKPTSTMVITPNYTGLTEIKLESSRVVIADVYNEIGSLIQSNISSYTYNDALLLRLEKGKKYFIFMRYSYETSGTIHLKFNQLTESYNNVTGLSTYDTYGKNNTNSQYVFLNLTTGGMYSIYTNLEYDDTTIRIYDEKLRILGESFDPNADWNEDEPDLNAHCYLSSSGPNRKVIVQLFRPNPQIYKVYVNYVSFIID